MKTWRVSRGMLLAATAALAPGLSPAFAQSNSPAPNPLAPAPIGPSTPQPAAEKVPPPGFFIDGIHFSALLDAGVNFNPYRPDTGLNFGQSFVDRANSVLLNQILLTANKPLDPKNSDFQWGFKLQGMYGSDARYTQYLGIFNNALPGDRNQFDLVEANVLFHLPVATQGGTDLKIGFFPTPLGYETIDPSTNPFYTHSYIFDYGLPFKHTGALAVVHVNDMVDIYAGIDTGSNTTWGPLGEDNSAVSGIAGFNLTLMDGNLTILALTHAGPEQPSRFLSTVGANANGYWRYYNDILATYKLSDAVALVTEFNWVRDDYGTTGKPVNGFGVAQYVSYALNDHVTLNARAEFWRDDNNFFVASFASNNGPVRAQQGLPIGVAYGAAGTNATYTAITLGMTWKPDVPVPVTGLLIRPEIRWDHAYTSSNTFDINSTGNRGSNNSVLFAADAVITF